MHLPLIFNQAIKDNLNANQFESHQVKFKKRAIFLINPNGNGHTQKKIIALNLK